MTHRFIASPKLTFATANADAKRLQAMLSKPQPGVIEIDLSKVTQCDSAGLALLIEAKRGAMARGLQCEFIDMSSDIRHLAEFCGVEALLMSV